MRLMQKLKNVIKISFTKIDIAYVLTVACGIFIILVIGILVPYMRRHYGLIIVALEQIAVWGIVRVFAIWQNKRKSSHAKEIISPYNKTNLWSLVDWSNLVKVATVILIIVDAVVLFSYFMLMVAVV